MHVMCLGQHELTVAAPASAKPKEDEASVRAKEDRALPGHSSSSCAFDSRARLCFQEQNTPEQHPEEQGDREI